MDKGIYSWTLLEELRSNSKNPFKESDLRPYFRSMSPSPLKTKLLVPPFVLEAAKQLVDAGPYLLPTEDIKPKNINPLEGWKRPNISLDARLMLGENNADLTSELETFVENKGYDMEPGFLAQFIKKGVQGNIDLSPYSVVRDAGKGISRQFPRYYDVPYSLVLLYNAKPIASISFEAQEGSILVSQIQGVAGQQERLQPLVWGQALLALVFKWAEENGIPEVRVLPYNKNLWVAVRLNGRYKQIYDYSAQRLGFAYDESMELYRKQTNLARPILNAR